MSSTVVCPNCRFVLAGNKPPHSPVPTLLESNDIPSDLQISIIQQVITEARLNISRLDAEIEKVRSVLDQLVKDVQNAHTSSISLSKSLAGIFTRRKQAEISQLTTEVDQVRALLDQLLTDRWELHDFMQDHCALLSPIRRLCAELLSEVFIRCLPTWGESLTVTPLQAPWLLGRICRRWRDVALSTPRLWSSIIVHLTMRDVIPQGNTLRTWLARSKACPLSLSFIISSSPLWGSHPAFDLVLSSCHRWQHFHLFRSSAMAWDFQPFHAIDGHLPLLRRLRIGDQSLGVPMLVLLTAPQLRVLEVRSQGRYGFGLLTSELPWAQLTHCETEDTSFESGLEVLHFCQNLVEFTLKCTLPTFHFPYLPHVIRHQQLRRLHIAWADVSVANLFERLDLPALRELDIGPMESWPQTQFILFLRRSHSSIEHLTLKQPTFTGNELIDCLLEMPALKCLDINETINSGVSTSKILTDDVLRRLTSDLTPELRSISFRGPTFNHNLFYIMIQSRWHRPNHGGRETSSHGQACKPFSWSIQIK